MRGTGYIMPFQETILLTVTKARKIQELISSTLFNTKLNSAHTKIPLKCYTAYHNAKNTFYCWPPYSYIGVHFFIKEQLSNL